MDGASQQSNSQQSAHLNGTSHILIWNRLSWDPKSGISLKWHMDDDDDPSRLFINFILLLEPIIEFYLNKSQFHRIINNIILYNINYIVIIKPESVVQTSAKVKLNEMIYRKSKSGKDSSERIE